jgi:hypothetical protein
VREHPPNHTSLIAGGRGAFHRIRAARRLPWPIMDPLERRYELE